MALRISDLSRSTTITFELCWREHFDVIESSAIDAYELILASPTFKNPTATTSKVKAVERTTQNVRLLNERFHTLFLNVLKLSKQTDSVVRWDVHGDLLINVLPVYLRTVYRCSLYPIRIPNNSEVKARPWVPLRDAEIFKLLPIKLILTDENVSLDKLFALFKELWADVLDYDHDQQKRHTWPHYQLKQTIFECVVEDVAAVRKNMKGCWQLSDYAEYSRSRSFRILTEIRNFRVQPNIYSWDELVPWYYSVCNMVKLAEAIDEYESLLSKVKDNWKPDPSNPPENITGLLKTLQDMCIGFNDILEPKGGTWTSRVRDLVISKESWQRTYFALTRIGLIHWNILNDKEKGDQYLRRVLDMADEHPNCPKESQIYIWIKDAREHIPDYLPLKERERREEQRKKEELEKKRKEQEERMRHERMRKEKEENERRRWEEAQRKEREDRNRRYKEERERQDRAEQAARNMEERERQEREREERERRERERRERERREREQREREERQRREKEPDDTYQFEDGSTNASGTWAEKIAAMHTKASNIERIPELLHFVHWTFQTFPPKRPMDGLGTFIDAKSEAISRTQFRKLILVYHPDKNQDIDEQWKAVCVEITKVVP